MYSELNLKKIKRYIQCKDVELVFRRILDNFSKFGIDTNTALVMYVDGQTPLNSTIRDVLHFDHMGENGLRAIYSYLRDIGYCPFKDGYRRREVV